MNRKILFALTSALGLSLVAAENINLSGTVVQSSLAYGSVTTGTPIAGVNVSFPRLGLNASTTAQGTFSIVQADVAVLPQSMALRGNVLDLQAAASQPLNVVAKDVQGRSHQIFQSSSFRGELNLNQAMAELPMGAYVVQVQYGKEFASLKVNKIESEQFALNTEKHALVATDSLVFTKTGYKRQAIPVLAASANVGYVPMQSSSSTVISSSAVVSSSSGGSVSTGKAMRLAYLYTDNATEVNRIDWTKFTHVGVFTTLGPQDDGSLYRYKTYGNVAISNGVWAAGSSFKNKYVNELKAQGIKALLVLGGAGWPSDSMASVCKNTADRDNMIQQAIEMVKGTWIQANGTTVNDTPFDGIDVDWEFPVTLAQKQCLDTIVKKLKAGLPGKTVSVANSYSVGYYDVPGLISAGVDWIGVMAYDFSTSTNPDHSPYGSSVSAVNNYIAAGAPANKLLLGIGLYGRVSSGTIDWRDYYTNTAYAKYFTSKDSTLAKADFVLSKGLAGVMYWEATQDAYGTTSAMTTWVDDRLKASSK